MKSTVRLLAWMVVVCAASLVLGAARAVAQGNSHVRIVRLSFVEGTVTLSRPDASGWAVAPVNTPIQEGFKLSTGDEGYAEVEFENGSTARIGQLSQLDFDQLQLAEDGSKINRLTLEQGYATFHVTMNADDVYEVKASSATIAATGRSAEFRVDLGNGAMRVEVPKGAVEVSGPSGSQTVAKNDMLVIQPGAAEAYQSSHGITKDDWDAWVADRDNQTALVAQGPPLSSGYTAASGGCGPWGWSDLNMYGNWGYMPGYGSSWFPTVSAGWYPYSSGRWSWYPSYGYTWIASEPWGWLPYHYGLWNYDPVFGWFWNMADCGLWSPALVNWYAGPGWVGWMPQANPNANRKPRPMPKPGPTPRPKPPGANPSRMVVVDVTRLQNGKPITPNDLRPVNIDEERAQKVERPDIPPGRLALLPGPPVPGPASLSTRVNGNLAPRAPSQVWSWDRGLYAGSGSGAFAEHAPRTLAVPPSMGFGERGGRASSSGFDSRVAPSAAGSAGSSGGWSASHSGAPSYSGGGHVSSGGGGGGGSVGHASSGGGGGAPSVSSGGGSGHSGGGGGGGAAPSAGGGGGGGHPH